MQHDYQHVPVTALAFIRQDLVAVGEGLHVTIYDVKTRQRVKDWPIFPSQSVHGIAVHDELETILVRGGSLIRTAVTSNPDAGLDFAFGAVQDAEDWVLDATFAPSTEGTPPLAAIVTAHNALALVRVEAHGTTLAQLVPGSNCILYSAHIRWLSPSHCLVASGTAFGDVILWSAFLTAADGRFTAHTQIHHTFSAHEGSVFGVQLSSLSTLPGADCDVRVLASCSDDRTIRLWDVSDLSVTSPTLTEIQRDTGFGAGVQGGTDVSAPTLLAKAMGHISRIWRAMFVDSCGSGFRIVSFGEDASNITWELRPARNGAASTPFVLEQMHVETAHAGKNIWSAAVDHASGRTLTGGADGAVALRVPTSSPDLPAEIDHGALNNDGGDDNFRTYCFIADGRLISTTNGGAICHVHIGTEGHGHVHHISLAIKGLRGYSVIASASGVAFIAGHAGDVSAYCSQPGLMKQIASVEQKVAGLFACRHTEDSICVLITTVGTCAADLLLFDLHATGEIHQTASHTLSLPAGFIVTSLASCERDRDMDLALGSRSGIIAVYRVGTSTTEGASAPITHHRVHAKEAVTALKWLSDHNDRGRSEWLLSTGRDGTFAVNKVRHNNEHFALHLTHQLALPFGPNIEGFDVSRPDQLAVWGFRSKAFVVYDLLLQRETMAVECGGAHRNWSFQPQPDPRGAGNGSFAWTQASALRHVTQRQPLLEIIDGAGGHGREIKTLAIAPTALSQPHMFATGSEDTNIKLWIDRDGGRPRCVHTLRRHNTGLQHLQWLEADHVDGPLSLFSSGGAEDFYVWRVTRSGGGGAAGVPDRLGVGVVCESAHPRCGASDLRIMAFDVRRKPGSHEHDWTRRSKCMVFMAYSDSTVKLWHYAPTSAVSVAADEPAWALLAAGDYLTACLTQAIYLAPQEAKTGIEGESVHSMPLLLTAAADGHVGFWTIEPSDDPSTLTRRLRWTHRHRVHQNAIHAMVAHTFAEHDGGSDTEGAVSKPRLAIITGGDDNALALTLAPNHHSPASAGLPGISTLRIPRAHAAAVTGVAVLRSRSSRDAEPPRASTANIASEPETEAAKTTTAAGKTTLEVVSTGLDQRVRTWRFDFAAQAHAADVQVERVGRAVATPVADVSGVAAWPLEEQQQGTALEGGEHEGQETAKGGGMGPESTASRVLVSGVGLHMLRLV